MNIFRTKRQVKCLFSNVLNKYASIELLMTVCIDYFILAFRIKTFLNSVLVLKAPVYMPNNKVIAGQM